MNTKNKIALVTGGSRGLGRNMALAIAKKGINVMLTYHSNKEAADNVVAEIESLGQKAVAFQLDTSNTKLFAIFNIHYKGVFFLTQKALPFINNGGGIVNISSGLSRMAYPGSSVYASMKGAVEILTRYLAKELGPRKIRVNAVAPGAIETDFGGGRTRDNKEINERIASVTALGRVGLPDDIGGVVAFLCTEDAGWINAQRIEVSGGQAL